MIGIGVDPGWKTFGISVTYEEKVIASSNFNPSSKETPYEFLNSVLFPFLVGAMGPYKLTEDIPVVVFVERFVSYDGVLSAAAEKILMMIGATDFFFRSMKYEVHLVRAIDWKTGLCKFLVKNRGFHNPYSNFDKRFSKLVAKELSGISSKISDHEADAICLSYIGGLLEK